MLEVRVLACSLERARPARSLACSVDLVRWIALWPVTGLFAGAAIGLAAAEYSHTRAWAAVVLALTVGATFSRVSRWRPAIFLALVWTAFASGGCLLLVHAWRDAWRPTLRTTFDAIVAR
jgi:hypothetical protein